MESARMHKITVTETTNVYGNVVLFTDASKAKVVYCECNKYMCIPFRYGDGIFGKILNVNGGTVSPHASAEVTIDVYYYNWWIPYWIFIFTKYSTAKNYTNLNVPYAKRQRR